MLERFYSFAGLLLCAVVLSAGCGSGGSGYTPAPTKPETQATFKPGDELSMFPAKVGNQWTYSVEFTQTARGKGSGSVRRELTLKAVGVTPIDGGSLLEIDVFGPSKDPKSTVPVKVDHQVWEVTTKGIYQRSVGVKPVVFAPYQPALLFPPDPERKFAWKGTGETPGTETGTQSLESKILAPQQVDTENEQFWAIPVETKGTFQSPKAKGQVASIAYWAPKVGLVRYKQEVTNGTVLVTVTMKLKAKSVQ